MQFFATLVSQKNPCSACVIITALNKEIMEKVKKQRDDFDYELINIDNPKELLEIEGVEVEKLPIILINSEQITAGSIMPVRKMNNILDDFL